ncbi:UNVERIFIED_CONTAM: PH, RCC1 and FYVE domains-containing protein 1 [Sesamum angustifolium]|uniref:PH, RCC1 and FYVE domains-containing protein 1 n=1 Tax=Sesamum angustifolium TaxID=2727405 RepID=A0AAW2LWR2_9LAMI
MADLVSYGNADRDTEQALIALKKGAQLLKYGRKGKPKFYPFRLSNDETTLIWISNSGERNLKLASVSRIIPGQRTAVFQRYLRPEKDYLSFSLIYNNGKRSLDLVCKDKVEAEIWIAGLKALISSGQAGRSKIDGWSDGGLYFDDNRDLTSNSPSNSSVSGSREVSSREVSISSNPIASPKSNRPDNLVHSERSHVASDQKDANLVSDAFRVSVSSAPSTSSHGSAQDDCDVLGMYIYGVKLYVITVSSWGEESGFVLDMELEKMLLNLVCWNRYLFLSVDFVACGEFHTCAVTMAGELYTWGDGTHNAGLLGHGTDVSHWIPREFQGNCSHPREIESLSGLRTIAVACGVWHTAAVVEVIVTQSSASFSSGKMFTWGDGDKNRLGHGDKEPRLKPTCVPALIDYNFHKIACGHSLTVGLTTSGHVFTMGSTVYGQLGNPQSDGKLPCLVEDKLSGESVEEIACGAYHVAVLTSKNEVYTWGKGANGRLGHGDIEDRKAPTLVESLKDKHSQCSACRQAFGFTRKRHNCYNCGLVHCHACSSRKAVRAALAPNPSKLYRVCDSCLAKLSKVAEAGSHNPRNNVPRLSGENKDRLDKADLRLVKSAMPSNFDLIRQLDTKAAKQGKKADTFFSGRSSQASMLQLRDAVTSTAIDLRRTVPKPILTHSSVSSRSVSPFSRKPSPPRSATPVPTTSGLSFSKSMTDSLKKTNELLNQEVHNLRVQAESLRSRCELQELELQKSAKKAQEAMALAAEESAKCKAAKEVIKSLTAQLKDMAERLPPGAYDANSFKLVHLPNGLEPNGMHYPVANGERNSRFDASNRIDLGASNRMEGASVMLEDTVGSTKSNSGDPGSLLATSNGTNDHADARLPNGSGSFQARSGVSEGMQDAENSLKSRNSVVSGNANQIEAEWIEQYEPGVYISPSGRNKRSQTRTLQVMSILLLVDMICCRRRFGEHQAETWWSENREKVYERYNVRGSDKSSVAGYAAQRSEGAFSPSSQVI